MKKIIFLLPILFLLSCASSTYIKTLPEGAKIKEGDILKGVTPYLHWDRGIGTGGRTFTLQMEGYKDKTIIIERREFKAQRIILLPVLAWPWIFGYPDEYFFELEKAVQNDVPSSIKQNIPVSSKISTQPSKVETEHAQKLRELKKLRDEGLLSDVEYELKRKAIIDSM